ncbi:2-hydroxycarboxylate transporter family protein, partial [Salmonella enterica subsp. enterica serovar Agona]|nr:2-hydroxycarboxylate transporter family protein [Salmonella enterica subsp. enterica serovar Agona]
LALSAVCLLFTLNHSANALVSSPSTLNPGTNVAKLAEQAPVHGAILSVNRKLLLKSLLGYIPTILAGIVGASLFGIVIGLCFGI